MEILGIGPMELILILVIAMLVFGPDKLPEIGAKLGQSMRAMRRATREFSREIEETRRVIEEPIRELKEPLQEVTQPLQQMRDDLRGMAPLAQSITNPQEALRQAVTRELSQSSTPAQEPPVEATAAQAGVSSLAPDLEAETPVHPAETGVVVEGEPPAAAGTELQSGPAPDDAPAPSEPVEPGSGVETIMPPAAQAKPVSAEGPAAPDPLPTDRTGPLGSKGAEE